MKKVILIQVFSVVLLFSALGQANLEFNAIQLITSSQSVPTGKVWKVESVLGANNLQPSFAGCGAISSVSQVISVNSTNITVKTTYHAHGSGTCSTGQGQSMESSEITKLPLWLPAGTSLAPGSNVNSISVIEFNLIE